VKVPNRDHEFDQHERRLWAGRAEAYARSFAELCAHPAGDLLDLAGVAAGTRLLDVGTGPGTVARLGHDRGAKVTAVDAEDSMVRMTAAAVPEAEARLGILPGLPFAEGAFDAVVANFVINHVGDPAAAVAEMRRVTAPASGRIAVSIWPQQAATVQSLWWQAIDASGATRPELPRVAAELDFERTPAGLTGLPVSAGLDNVQSRTVEWTWRVDPDDWWSGLRNGLGTIGYILAAQPPEMVNRIKSSFDDLSASYLDNDGLVAVPTIAVLASGVRA
jgi:SAM-dependent methyltransferase